jgi:hypothetical protein
MNGERRYVAAFARNLWLSCVVLNRPMLSLGQVIPLYKVNRTDGGIYHLLKNAEIADDLNCGSILKLKFDIKTKLATAVETCVDSEEPQESVILSIDICLHPTYCIPCPYLRAYDSSGSLYSVENILKLFSTRRSSNSSIVEHGDDFDLVTDNDGSDLMTSPILFCTEEHPFNGRPYTTLELCGLRERLESVELVENNRETTLPSELYLLNWFSVVGPGIGLPTSPAFYVAAKEALLTE